MKSEGFERKYDSPESYISLLMVYLTTPSVAQTSNVRVINE
jgi:hypothetical protein